MENYRISSKIDFVSTKINFIYHWRVSIVTRGYNFIENYFKKNGTQWENFKNVCSETRGLVQAKSHKKFDIGGAREQKFFLQLVQWTPYHKKVAEISLKVRFFAKN